MSDEIKAAGCGCYDSCEENDWIWWILIGILVIWIFGGFGGRGSGLFR